MRNISVTRDFKNHAVNIKSLETIHVYVSAMKDLLRSDKNAADLKLV